MKISRHRHDSRARRGREIGAAAMSGRDGESRRSSRRSSSRVVPRARPPSRRPARHPRGSTSRTSRGWGEGYDADDEPRAALANAAQIAADVDPTPVEDDIDALDQPAAKLEVREVRWEDEEATRSKLGRADSPTATGTASGPSTR